MCQAVSSGYETIVGARECLFQVTVGSHSNCAASHGVYGCVLESRVPFRRLNVVPSRCKSGQLFSRMKDVCDEPWGAAIECYVRE